MPVLTGPILLDGALVDVQIGWSGTAVQVLRQSLRPVPPPVDTRALLDTGAEVTCIDPSVVQALGLGFGSVAPVNVPAAGGLLFRSQQAISLTLLHPSNQPQDHLAISDLVVVEVALRVLGYDVLIGRDVLDLLRFVYDGPKRWFELTY